MINRLKKQIKAINLLRFIRKRIKIIVFRNIEIIEQKLYDGIYK